MAAQQFIHKHDLSQVISNKTADLNIFLKVLLGRDCLPHSEEHWWKFGSEFWRKLGPANWGEQLQPGGAAGRGGDGSRRGRGR